MATSAEALYEHFGHPSPGTASMFLQFLNEDSQLLATNSGSPGLGCVGNEAESSPQGVQGPAPVLGQLAAGPGAQYGRQAQPLHHARADGYSARPEDAIPSAAETACCSSQAPAFTLGSTPFGSSSQLVGEEASAAVRRRGRKPKPRLPDLQQKLEALMEQFHVLSKENVFLQNKLKILERVVPSRDESAGLLTKLLSAAQGHAAQAPTPAQTTDGSMALQAPDQALAAQKEAEYTWSEARAATAVARLRPAQRGINVVEKGIKLYYSHAAASKTAFLASKAAKSAKARKASSGPPPVVAMCPSADGEMHVLSPEAVEELKNVTPEDMRLLWKHVCLQLGVMLVGADAHGIGSPQQLRLERFLQRVLMYMDKITLLSPTCFIQSMYINVETGQHERPNDYFWIACARALKLSPQQLHDVASLATVYERNVAPVQQQRMQLTMQLSRGLASGPLEPPKTSTTGLSQSWYTVDDLAKQLERNVLKEHQTHLNIGDFLCSSVLTPLQVARSITVAYPYIPDGVAMLHAFKVLGGEGNQLPQPRQAPVPNADAAGVTTPQLLALGNAGSSGGSAAQPSCYPRPAAATGLAPGFQQMQPRGGLQPAGIQPLLGPNGQYGEGFPYWGQPDTNPRTCRT